MVTLAAGLNRDGDVEGGALLDADIDRGAYQRFEQLARQLEERRGSRAP